MSDDVQIPSLTEIKSGNQSIPIPDPSFLMETVNDIEGTEGTLSKYAKEYDKFCRWIAIPSSERNPKTVVAFEKKWKIPKGYTKTFKKRKDFNQIRLEYFWEWMIDHLPDVVEGMYKRALKNSSADARYFAELISKRIDVEKPPEEKMQNFFLIGVPQEKVDALFAPKEYVENAKILTPENDE